MSRRRFMRLFWLGIAALFIVGALHGTSQAPAYCGASVCHGYSTPAPDDSPAHPLRHLIHRVTRGKP